MFVDAFDFLISDLREMNVTNVIYKNEGHIAEFLKGLILGLYLRFEPRLRRGFSFYPETGRSALRG